MGVKVANNAFGTLSAGITTSDTTITLDSGEGARFPSLSSGEYFYATIVDTSNNLEIIKVTARSSDSMTVTRAQDGTTARAFSIGDRFELRPVAALFEDIIANASVDGITSASTSGTAIDIDSSNNVAFDTNTLYVDSTNNRVGIGTTSPAASGLDVTKAGGGNFVAQFTNTTAATPYGVWVKEPASAANGYPSLQVTDSAGTTTRFRVDSGTGNVLMPSQPCFSGHKFSGTDGTRSTGITNSASWTFTDILLNRGSDWNNTAGEFICPVAGAYFAILNFNRREAYNDWHGGAILQNSTVRAQSWEPPGTSTNQTYAPMSLSCILNASANDAIVPIYYTAYSDPEDNALENNFSVWLLG